MSKLLSVYLCYALEDKTFAREILNLIAQQRFQAYRSNRFTPEDRWQRDVQDALAFIYILSHNARKSSLCIQQWKYAIKCSKHIVVLKLDEATLPDEMRHADTIDFLDFVEIGRQIAEGIPSLRKDRYAIDVTLRMFVAELAEIERRAGGGINLADLDATDEHTTLQLPPDDDRLNKIRSEQGTTDEATEHESAWKKIARRFRKLRNGE